MADGELIFDTKINASGFTKGIGKLGNLAKKSVAGIAAATAAASATRTRLSKCFVFCIRSLMHVYYRALEVQILACQRMVQVESYLVVAYLSHLGVEASSLGIHQRNDVAHEENLLVEFSVGFKKVAWSVLEQLGIVNAVSVFLS